MSSARSRLGSWFAIPFVASRDLANEKLITICLVLSVVAVLTPIMLLTSVKVGFIDRLRADFIGDPAFREIRPADADLRQRDFFAEVKTWPGVIYAVPSVMLVPREVDLVAGADRKRTTATLVPTDDTDPLFEKLTGDNPAGDNVVVTTDVAAELGLAIGDTFDVTASRVENDQRKRVSLTLTIVGTIPDESLPQPSILADPVIDMAVENYRAGIAVPERGWSGIASVPRQTFASIMVKTDEPLGETDLANLRIRIGATGSRELPASEAMALFGAPAGASAEPAGHLYLIEKSGRTYTDSDLTEARDVLANMVATVIGVNAPAPAEAFGQPVDLVGYDPAVFPDLAARAAAWSVGPGVSFQLNNGVYFPAALRPAWEAAGSPAIVPLTIKPPEGWASPALTISVHALGFEGTETLVSPSLLGMIYRGAATALAFDPTAGNIVEQSTGFRGFRVIADDITTVPSLVERFEALGMAVRAKSDEILKLQRLERSLDILVLVIASVALAGGYAILSASFFANVQRKRVDFATIRLIGMRKTAVFQIPTLQATIIASLGFALSCVLYFLVSALLNGVVATELNFDGQLSKLYPEHFLLVGIFVVAGSCIASLAASREATRIDPAQAIRAG